MHDNSHRELYQYQTLLTVSSAWLINTLSSPYQAKKEVGESTQAMLVSYVMSAKRHCQMLVLETVTHPKSTPLAGVQYVSMHYTSKIIKIARMSVKPIQKDAQHV